MEILAPQSDTLSMDFVLLPDCKLPKVTQHRLVWCHLPSDWVPVGTQGMGNVRGHPGAGGLMFLKDGGKVALTLGNLHRQEGASGTSPGAP